MYEEFQLPGKTREDDRTKMTDPEVKKGKPGGKGSKMSELLIIAMFLVGWYVLNAFVLPWFGVST